MMSGLELIILQLKVSLFLGFLGSIAGTGLYLFLTKQLSILKDRKIKQFSKIYFVFFSLIFVLTFLLLFLAG